MSAAVSTRNVIRAGQTWRYKSPAGAWRQIFVCTVTSNMFGRRARGPRERTGRQWIQVPAYILEQGLHEAHVVEELAGYVWEKKSW